MPVVPHNTNYRDYAVLVERGKISAIGPREELIVRHPDAERIELNDHVLLPGFINAHTHAAMSLLRGIADDLPLETWLHDHIWPAEAKWVDEQFIEDGSELAIAEMLALAAVQYSVLLAPELGISELSIFLQPVLDGRSSLQCKWRQLAKWLRRWW